MKIIRNAITRMTIEEFADKHSLVMEVNERSGAFCSNPSAKYYARFQGAEVSENGCMLKGAYGNGANEEEAITKYAQEISEHLLIINAMSREDRREIVVPKLVAKAMEGE